MRVLLTGAFGNIGQNTLLELLNRDHQVRCFDLYTKQNARTAAKYTGRVEIVWGDIRRREDVERAVADCDVVIHLAAIIPPLSEARPAWAQTINVEGTRTIIAAMRALPQPPSLIFASSISVFGPQHDTPPPRRASDPVQPTDHYSHHKIVCEQMIRHSGLRWTILRLGVVPPIRLTHIDPVMFEVSLDTRLEYVHPRDVGLALANAVVSTQVWGKTLLIGGGPACQMRYRDYVGGALKALGIGRLPEKAFSAAPFYTDWMDTTESQALLCYQRHGFEVWLRDLRQQLGILRYLVPVARPFIRWGLLWRSPHYRASLSWLRYRWAPQKP